MRGHLISQMASCRIEIVLALSQGRTQSCSDQQGSPVAASIHSSNQASRISLILIVIFYLIRARQWIHILYSLLIKLSVINTYPDITSFLLNKLSWCHPRTRAFFNYIFFQHHLNLAFHFRAVVSGNSTWWHLNWSTCSRNEVFSYICTTWTGLKPIPVLIKQWSQYGNIRQWYIIL